MTFTPPITVRLADADAEKIRRNHDQRISELQALPAAAMTVIRNVSLPTGAAVAVAHGLGRAPLWVSESIVRGSTSAGAVSDLGSVDLNGNPIDRSKVVVLFALGFGVTITVDVAFL